ncbi:MAG: radical SAM protein [Candidatus Aenigmarchaeota archaeon]|nr:radical SAM protein [Candidatus Aenigmarchaeota archaeon]
MGRYLDITKNRKYAKYLIAKTIPMKLPKSYESLWKEHERGMREFRKALKAHDKAKRELKFAKHSLVDLKLEIAKRMLEKCEFCERKCKINRKKGERGFCKLGKESLLSSEFIHMGEEASIIPSHTFFFLGCNFYCIYCQNWTISRQKERGMEVDGKTLAGIAKKREHESRNINLVGGDPIPNLHTILEMLKHLDVNKTIVWNSNMYMSRKTMRLLDGVIDVYLADFKYGNDGCAKKLSKAPNYWKIITRNYKLAKAEILIRHLVLPGHLECCTKPIMEWMGKNLGNKIRLNIMGQYHPEFEIFGIKEMCRRVERKEMERAYELARKNGLSNLEP